MRDATVAAGVAGALMRFAQSKGADARALSERSGVDLEALEDQDNRIAFSNYVSLMRAARALTGDPALALHFGEAFDMGEFTVVGLIGRTCETAAEAFAQLNRYSRLVVEVDLGGGERFRMQPEHGRYWVIDSRQNPNAFPELTESTFARMASSTRRIGAGDFLKEVHVTHAAPDYRAEYDRIFRAPIVFESDKNALLLDQTLLNYRNPNASRYAFGVLSSHAEALLRELEGSKTTRGRVENLLLLSLHTGEANIEMIAGKMGITRQTLFRKLKAEGATFEKVLDALRRQLALDYLRGDKASVNEIAYLVGFSEPAAFSRAFRRWTGASPREYRLAERSRPPAAPAARRSAARTET